MQIKKGVSLAITLLAHTLVLGCGEPLDPSCTKWVPFAQIPDNYRAEALTTTTAGGLLMVAYDYSAHRYCVLSYAGGGFTEAYVLPVSSEEARLTSIHCAGSVIWAGGGRRENGVESPLLIRRSSTRQWEVIPVPAMGGGAATNIYALDENECWFTRNAFSRDGENWGGYLTRYRQGVLTTYDELAEVTFAVVGDNDTFKHDGYDVIAAPVVFNRVTPKDYYLYKIKGGGNNQEKISLDWRFPLRGKLKRVEAVGCINSGVLLIAELTENDVTYTAIVERDIENRGSKSELLFYSPIGPHFNELEEFIYQSKKIDPTRGPTAIGIGYETSVYFNGVSWLIEEVPYGVSFYGVAHANDGGYWALARDTWGFGKQYIFYHR